MSGGERKRGGAPITLFSWLGGRGRAPVDDPCLTPRDHQDRCTRLSVLARRQAWGGGALHKETKAGAQTKKRERRRVRRGFRGRRPAHEKHANANQAGEKTHPLLLAHVKPAVRALLRRLGPVHRARPPAAPAPARRRLLRRGRGRRGVREGQRWRRRRRRSAGRGSCSGACRWMLLLLVVVGRREREGPRRRRRWLRPGHIGRARHHRGCV